MDNDEKARAVERISAKIDEESKSLPYRWGYFQGAILVPWSLFLIFTSCLNMREPRSEPLYISVITILIGLAGLPLSVGLLLKRRFARVLVYVVFGLTLLLVAIKLPVAIVHYRDEGGYGSAISEAELLLVWLCSMVYYRKRQIQFH